MINPLKNLNHSIFFISLLCLPLVTQAADNIPDHLNCAAGRVAIARQQQAIEAEMAQIEELANESQSVSDDIGKCIGGLAIDIKIPTFPSMSDIWETVKNEACKVAKKEIDEQKGKLNIPSSLDPWGEAMKHVPKTDYDHLLPKPNKENHNIINTQKDMNFSDSDAFPWSLD